MRRANADLILPVPVLSSCARVGTKKKRPLPLHPKMTGGEDKVWQCPEKAARTQKKEEKVYFFLFPKDFLRCLSARYRTYTTISHSQRTFVV